MKTELKDLSATRKQIDIQIDAAAVRAAYDQISDRYAKAANVPGFRPGHAPRAVVRTRFKDQIRTEVLRELLPEIKLNEYKGLSATRRTRSVKDEDVDRVIESLRENSATLEPVEDRGAQLGDTVTANFHGKFLSEPEAEPINVEDVDVVLGGDGVVREINENLIGAKPDDEKTFTVDYPADFTSKGLAGKPVEYRIKVNALRIKELPGIDDGWARSLGDEIESLAQLREKIRSDLDQQVKNEADVKMRSELVRKLVEAHQFELPERLLEHQTEHRLEL